MKKVSLPHQLSRRFYELILHTQKILMVKMDSSLRRKIIGTNFSTFFLGILDSGNRVARIAGHKINYCTETSLRVLYAEIFIRQEYFFSAGTQKPFIIDCGSNIGMSILYFKLLYPQSEILAFEPDKEAFSCLEKNIRENALTNVELHRQALSDKEGTVDLYYDPTNPGSLLVSTIKERMPKQKQLVSCTLLSGFIDKEVDFLKIDIEGAEKAVLEDLRRENKLGLVKQLVIEYHHHIHKDIDEFSQILAMLEHEGFGYQIESLLFRPLMSRKFQDILIYAYKKRS